jgi:hypothetical protein
MSAATVSALALISLIVFFIVESRPQKKTLSMLDLAEFKDLPSELRAMVRSMIPNGSQLKKQWAHMTPQQKQMVIQQISSQLPQKPQQDNRPPAPSVVIKPETPKIQEEEPRGLKPGFLLSNSVDKGKKKNTKNKKHDEVITLGDVGASEDEEPVSTDITDADA